MKKKDKGGDYSKNEKKLPGSFFFLVNCFK